MKKLLIALAVTALTGTVFAQSMKPVSGAKVDKNTKLPVEWLIQAHKADKLTPKVKLNAQGRFSSVEFAPAKGNLEFFGNSIPFKKGEQFTLTAKVKGTGKVRLSHFAYRATNGYIYYKRGTIVELTGKEQVIKETFTVEDGKKFPVASIRPAISIFQGTKCEVFDITFSKK